MTFIESARFGLIVTLMLAFLLAGTHVVTWLEDKFDWPFWLKMSVLLLILLCSVSLFAFLITNI